MGFSVLSTCSHLFIYLFVCLFVYLTLSYLLSPQDNPGSFSIFPVPALESIILLGALVCLFVWFILLPLDFFFLINLFIYLFLSALGLHCCAQAFSSCGEQGLLFVAVAQASHCRGFSCCRAWALGKRASVVVAHRL